MTRDVRWIGQRIDAGFSVQCPTLTTTQLLVMEAVHVLPGAAQTQLTAATLVDRSTLSTVVRHLIEAGFVVRTTNEADQRAYSVDLTKAGRTTLKEARAKLVKVEKSLVIEAKALAVSW